MNRHRGGLFKLIVKQFLKTKGRPRPPATPPTFEVIGVDGKPAKIHWVEQLPDGGVRITLMKEGV